MESGNLEQKIEILRHLSSWLTCYNQWRHRSSKQEFEGFRELLDHRAICHKIRWVHCLNDTGGHVYVVMADVDPDELENGKPRLKVNKAKGQWTDTKS